MAMTKDGDRLIWQKWMRGGRDACGAAKTRSPINEVISSRIVQWKP